jgi:hypothetical protein
MWQAFIGRQNASVDKVWNPNARHRCQEGVLWACSSGSIDGWQGHCLASPRWSPGFTGVGQPSPAGPNAGRDDRGAGTSAEAIKSSGGLESASEGQRVPAA